MDPETEQRFKELQEQKDLATSKKLEQLDNEFPLQDRILAIEEMNAEKNRLKELEELEKWEKEKVLKDEQASAYATMTVAELYKKDYPPESYIIDRFLPTTGFTMFSGDSGVGKSWISLEIVRAITNNDIFLDHFEIKTSHVPILIIDKENGLRRLQGRLKSLGVPATDQVHLLASPEKFTLEDEEFMRAVRVFIEQNKIGIVILDSFIDVLIGNENAAPDISIVFNALRSISTNVCWVLLHHESKPIPKMVREAGDRARGSTNIKAQLDYLFSVQRTKSLKTIHIEQGKARDYEAIPKFAVEFTTLETTGEMSGFKYLGEVKDDIVKIEEAKPMLYEFIKVNPFCTKVDFQQYLLESNIKPATTKIALESLMKQKIIDFVEKPGFGRKHFYFIVEGGETEDGELGDN